MTTRASEEGVRLLGIRVTPGRRLAFFAGVEFALVALAVLAAAALRFDGLPPRDLWGELSVLSLVAGVATVAANGAVGVYRSSWTFIGLRDLARGAVGPLFAAALLGILTLYTHASPTVTSVPRSVPLIFASLALCGTGAFRISKRAVDLLRTRRGNGEGEVTLLIGASDAGAQIVRSIQMTGAPYRVIGFLDDDSRWHGTSIHGVRVLGSVAHLAQFVTTYRVSTVIVCVPAATRSLVQAVVRNARAAGAKHVRIVPSLTEIVGGEVTINQARDVRLEDLLGRAPVRMQKSHVRDLVQGRRLLVTGGAGTIGGELCRQIARAAPAALVIADIDETRLHDLAVDLRREHPQTPIRELLLDVRREEAVRQALLHERPEIVFHAAAYKHVPMMEMFPLAALETNVLGTLHVMQAAVEAGAERFVLISTDKAVAPSSVMGASKRMAEVILRAPQGGQTMRTAVRFGNVIGSRGSVIPIFERQLASGGPLTVTHPEMARFFMMTSEAVALVLEAASLGQDKDLFVLDMGEPVRIVDAAREYIRLHGLRPDVDVAITFTGLRPGEKLRESLTYPHERLRPTSVDGIRVVESAEPAVDTEKLVERVRGAILRSDEAEARALLREMFPELGRAS